ncbi:MAG: hypothetical protein M1831_006621 [Alyxoria varia]|nr:MAG: hypothetical protein M1831_006621 [Alyxoria varia]
MAEESESSFPQEKNTDVLSPMLPSLKDRVSEDQVCRLTTSHYREAANTLAEAFAIDDVVRYLIDTQDRVHWSGEEKWNLHVSILEYVTYAHAMRGLVTTVGKDLGCVALWIPPSATIDSLITFLFSGLWRLYYKLSREGRQRFFREFCPLLHDTKHEVLGAIHDPQSYYLVYVGTKPSARGKGYAGKLIKATTDCADAEGVPCYLESSNAANLKLYERLGFEVRRRIWLERSDKRIPLDVMVREAVVSAATENGKVDETEPKSENAAVTTEVEKTTMASIASPPIPPTTKPAKAVRPTFQLKLNLSSPAVLRSSSAAATLSAGPGFEDSAGTGTANVTGGAFPESKNFLAAAAATGVTGSKITAYAVAKTTKTNAEDVAHVPVRGTGAAMRV